ncbi:Hypothetical protein NTJ_07163 [Nesidiocoris tenuis]|uniref:Uncharacterized protein n=1 Tax=Nesidiocoris tenuis TaxID=355587 RepID=A0ABN7ASC7_9HEMI|nr:Hypothetical protein NTJ_07163 [Nesidiocoris tenuis]
MNNFFQNYTFKFPPYSICRATAPTDGQRREKRTHIAERTAVRRVSQGTGRRTVTRHCHKSPSADLRRTAMGRQEKSRRTRSRNAQRARRRAEFECDDF